MRDETEVRSQFLSAEIQLAKTFIHIAETLDDPAKKTKCILCARTAYEAVLRFLPGATISEPQNEALRTGLYRVRSRLETLGERFERPNPISTWLPQLGRDTTTARTARFPAIRTQKDVARDVRRFLARCEQLRVEAQQILAQNKMVMNKATGA